MIVNYLLLIASGFLCAYGIYDLKQGKGRVRIVRTILALIVFVLVLVATIKGIPYNEFISMIEHGF